MVETFRETLWAEAGLPRFAQENHSRSQGGVLRGLHFSLAGGGQAKLVRVASGRIWDVAVDIRRSSPTFGQWQAFELDDVEHRQLFLPAGFAHGFCVLGAGADVVYKLSACYDPEAEFGIRWDDPAIGVEWPLPGPPVLSERDRANPSLDETRDRLPA